jgi:hypothetical protein
MIPPIAPFPCPICDAPPDRREHLRGAEICNDCGHGIVLNERGELIGYFTTQKSHPLGIRKGAIALLLVAVLGLSACSSRTAPVATQPAAPDELVIRESLPNDAKICVVLDPYHYAGTFVCMRVGEIRMMIRRQVQARLEVQP